MFWLISITLKREARLWKNAIHMLRWSIKGSLPSMLDGPNGNIFLTNAILCLKEGGMQARVENVWFDNCGKHFLKATIELVNPRLLVSLGVHAHQSIQRIYSLRPVEFRAAVSTQEGFQLPNGVLFFPMYHCGSKSLNMNRRLEQQIVDWKRVKRALEAS